MKYKLILLSVFLLYTNLYGADWIIKKDDGSKNKYDKLIILENDTLYVEKSTNIIGVPIENIQKIIYRGGTEAYCGGCTGATFATFAGIIGLGMLHAEEGVATDVVYYSGVIAGFLYGRNLFNKRFDLTQMSNEEKKDIINIIIAKYNK